MYRFYTQEKKNVCKTNQEQKQNFLALLFPKLQERFRAQVLIHKTIPPPAAFQNLLALETLFQQWIGNSAGVREVGNLQNFVSWGLFPADGEIIL